MCDFIVMYGNLRLSNM